MKHYVKVFLDSRNLTGYEALKCEWCFNNVIHSINHITPRGVGGSKTKDFPENLIGMCDACHKQAEAGKISREDLFDRVELILSIIAGYAPQSSHGS